MKNFIGLFTLLALCTLGTLPLPTAAQTFVPLGNGGFKVPGSLAFDNAGNLFIADSGDDTVKELTAASGYNNLTILPGTTSNFGHVGALALDRSNNVFIADLGDGVVKEILAPDYQTVRVIAPDAGTLLNPGFSPQAIAVDGAGNLFLLGQFPDQSEPLAEIPAAGGYDKLVVLPLNFSGDISAPILSGLVIDSAGNLFTTQPDAGGVIEVPAATGYASSIGLDANLFATNLTALAIDGAGNLFVGTTNFDGPEVPVEEIVAAGGYRTVTTVISSANAQFQAPSAIAIAPSGTLFTVSGALQTNPTIPNANVDEIFPTPTPLAASILPGSRAVAMGAPATVFATMINAGAMTGNNCRVELPSVVPAGLSLTYQTTDPATNALTGTANTPVSVAPGQLQTFLLAFESPNSFMASNFATVFRCDFATPAAAGIVPGVDTVDLLSSFAPTVDVIALEQVANADAILHVPTGSTGAFAIATFNAGAASDPNLSAGAIIVRANTGAATLPLAITLCNTNPLNGQCLAPPASAVPVSIAAGATPTFSVFASASGTIPVDPATNRVFVTFVDQDNNLVDSTSVAVASP